jgi:hypothetical protein
MDKLILTDIDGVVLNWVDGFHDWMQDKGYTKIPSNDYWIESCYQDMTSEQGNSLVVEFNSSNRIIGLDPVRDAVTGIAKLTAAGYTFHAITAMGECDHIKRQRRINLDTLFGTGVFTDLTLTPVAGDKVTPLSQYAQSGKYWIEDTVQHATLGLKLGLTPLLMDHVYNKECDVVGIKRVNCWDDICDLILGTT